ncbi:MAG: VOC family protein [Pyrinomonadaceae bacterium]|nr:VOC family protein [Pyrinomonadaceae bacterium]
MAIEIQGMTPLIQVFDMRRSLAFYRDVLGFEVVSDSGNGDDSSWVWIRKDECHLMLNDQYEPGNEPIECPAERIRWHGDTCLYFGADPDAAYKFFKARGIKVDPPNDAPYGMRQLYLLDPDGYNLCFQSELKNE